MHWDRHGSTYLFVTLKDLVRVRLLGDFLGLDMLHALHILAKVALQRRIDRRIVDRDQRRDQTGGIQSNGHRGFCAPVARVNEVPLTGSSRLQHTWNVRSGRTGPCFAGE